MDHEELIEKLLDTDTEEISRILSLLEQMHPEAFMLLNEEIENIL